MIWREIREKQEELLSKYASRSANTLGRMFNEEKCNIRTDFERDANRILYSMEFRRLRHKTQVFFNAKNDHICTRMEHVLYVASISSTIARTLNLNQDLAYAIALGHDLGHAPFGHSGERVLNNCVQKVNKEVSFHHELHSLRVVDRLATKISKDRINEKSGLNLTFEVRDGIVSHCGERYDEFKLHRDITKNMDSLKNITGIQKNPFTLEACIVRLVDKIAYVGRDIEDAVRVKLINIDDISKDVRKVLGNTNGEIINTLVVDIVENSYDKDYIALTKEKGEALECLIKENVKLIYKSEKINTYEKTAQNMMEALFFNLLENINDMDKLEKSNLKVYSMLYKFVKDMQYEEEETREQMVVDFIAGMTDSFAVGCFEEIYWL